MEFYEDVIYSTFNEGPFRVRFYVNNEKLMIRCYFNRRPMEDYMVSIDSSSIFIKGGDRIQIKLDKENRIEIGTNNTISSLFSEEKNGHAKKGYASLKNDVLQGINTISIDIYDVYGDLKTIRIPVSTLQFDSKFVTFLYEGFLYIKEKEWFLSKYPNLREEEFLTYTSQKTVTSSYKASTSSLQDKLDRYRETFKDNEAIGRDYERYIGYLYESDGYDVTYNGIRKGREDGGIDLICKKNNIHEIVQCKYWSTEKVIYEKNIHQLYGVTENYKLDINDKSINTVGVFISSTKVSDKAHVIANRFGIIIKENIPINKSYPCIKCNVSSSGRKIFHLPFDPQYDTTKIMKNEECYVNTIKEAEELHFEHYQK